jgi:uncharacterized phage protein (TIGR01671 family)
MKQRVIKFRIWCPTEKKFLPYPCFFSHLDFSSFGAFDRQFDVFEEGCVIQQSIGLKDNIGQDIYEGDIISFLQKNGHEEVGPVVYSDSQMAFVMDVSGRHLLDDKYGDYIPITKYKSYEILGNIFERGMAVSSAFI